MGLFSDRSEKNFWRFRPQGSGQDDTWTEPQAFLALIMAAASADGHVTPEENEQILNLLHRSNLFKQMTSEDMRKASNTVTDRLLLRRENSIRDACTALPEALRRACFAHVVEVVMADGLVNDAERQFLDDLMLRLSISEEDAQKIVEVLDIKNGC